MSFKRNTSVLLAAAVLIAAFAAAAIAQPKVKGTKCKVFPADNPWNQRVDQLPVAGDSNALVRSIGFDANAHADFGSGKWDGGPIGIPYVVVSSKQKKVRVSFEYADESDRVRYPVPKKAPIEGGRNADGDRHVIVIDRSKCKLYELYAAYPKNGGRSWTAGSGATWSLKSNRLRPAGWTSADAAGLPIYPGLARYDEVAGGEITHALRFTAPRTRDAYVYPARHKAGSGDDPDLPPMGARLRLKSSVNIASFPKQSRVILTALRRYGMILADNG
ncbi:MAG: hypothetical protein JHC98_11840, partial [Thermoleophilaceae bacterium]|nr:hypothetical protein [Thermoleophilaceae bacterium]